MFWIASSTKSAINICASFWRWRNFYTSFNITGKWENPSDDVDCSLIFFLIIKIFVFLRNAGISKSSSSFISWSNNCSDSYHCLMFLFSFFLKALFFWKKFWSIFFNNIIWWCWILLIFLEHHYIIFHIRALSIETPEGISFNASH